TAVPRIPNRYGRGALHHPHPLTRQPISYPPPRTSAEGGHREQEDQFLGRVRPLPKSEGITNRACRPSPQGSYYRGCGQRAEGGGVRGHLKMVINGHETSPKTA